MKKYLKTWIHIVNKDWSRTPRGDISNAGGIIFVFEEWKCSDKIQNKLLQNKCLNFYLVRQPFTPDFLELKEVYPCWSIIVLAAISHYVYNCVRMVFFLQPSRPFSTVIIKTKMVLVWVVLVYRSTHYSVLTLRAIHVESHSSQISCRLTPVVGITVPLSCATDASL